MSGSGGFYKYHCKYFLTHNCPNWVFVNNAPCAECCAAGREADHAYATISVLAYHEHILVDLANRTDLVDLDLAERVTRTAWAADAQSSPGRQHQTSMQLPPYAV